MHRLDLKMIEPGRLRGAGSEKAVEGEFDGTKHSRHGASVDPACMCHLVGRGTCLCCQRWHRRITVIEQRRVDSLRLQALGRRA